MTARKASDERERDVRSERRLIEAARDGSQEAMECLYRTYWVRAHRAAYLVVRDWAASEDIAQEAFVKAANSLDGFDRSRPFGPWIHRIVVNRAIDWCRRREARREVGERGHPQGASTVDLPERDPLLQDRMVKAIGELTVEHRAVVVLRYYLDYTPGEIARLLDVKRGTVNSRLRRALDQLGEAMEGAIE